MVKIYVDIAFTQFIFQTPSDRNEVERYFLRIKRFRRVFTRYDKLDVLYLGNLTLAMIFDAILM